MKPMLAHVFEPKRWTSGPAWVQPKFDGIRALYQNGVFQSRDELPFVLPHLADPLRAMFPDERTILDGELYVHGWPLGRINGAATPVRQQPNADTPLLEYYIFDRVSYELPFWHRFMAVSEKCQNLQHPHIHVATTVKYDDPAKVDAFYAMMVAEGFEGIMYRLGDCPYTRPKQEGGKKFLSDKNNRTWHLLKRKDWQDDEFICVRVEEGEGKRRNMVGALICETKSGRYFGVGSGLSDAEATHYLQHPPIGQQVKVKFRCYTADGVPFNPTVIAVL